jgi:hypothetical protein
MTQKYDSMYMISLWHHTTRRIEVFSRILKSMLKDYSTVLGKPAMYKITHDQRVTPFINETTKAIQLSMAIQKGKYNGEKDKFDEITFASERNSYES